MTWLYELSFPSWKVKSYIGKWNGLFSNLGSVLDPESGEMDKQLGNVTMGQVWAQWNDFNILLNKSCDCNSEAVEPTSWVHTISCLNIQGCSQCGGMGLSNPIHPVSKEGRESMADAEGRWFPFCISLDSALVMLEKKHLPEHLTSMSCVDTTNTLGTVLLELQDAGEAGLSHLQNVTA